MRGTSTPATYALKMAGAVFATFHRGIGFVAADGTDIDLTGVNLEALEVATPHKTERAVRAYGMAQYGCRVPSRKIAEIKAWRPLPVALATDPRRVNEGWPTLDEIKACYTVADEAAA